MEPNQNTYVPLLPYEEIKSMTEEDYDKYLSQKLSGFNEGGISGYAGPMLLKFKPISDEFSIEIHMAPIPNIITTDNDFYHPFSIQVFNILDKEGNDIFDCTCKGKDYKKGNEEHLLDFRYSLYPSHQIFFHRDLLYGIIAGKKIEDVDQINGTIHLSLPLNIQKLTLTEKDKGVEVKQGEAIWKVKTFEPKKIEIEVVEDVGHGVKVINHNIIDHVFVFQKGAKVACSATYFDYSASFSSKNHNFLGTESQSFIFDEPDQAPIDHIDLILYDEPVVKSYNFVLTKHTDTSEVVIRKQLNDVQKEIVQSLVDLKKMIDTKDVANLIEYLRKSVPDKEKEIFENEIVKSILKNPEEMFKYLSLLLFQNSSKSLFSFDLLDTNAVVWDIQNNTAKLEISPKDYENYENGELQVLHFIKNGDKWYLEL